ncbi:hypothetical protein FPQ18DRAFT_384143 [Pyronema domesticum]|nr:hypothetical protein FPQ18DRAFT_384143 [Pyronema domesticum]
MKFFSLTIATVLIATSAGGPVDYTYKPGECSATSTASNSCKKPQGHMIFRRERWRTQGQDCPKPKIIGTTSTSDNKSNTASKVSKATKNTKANNVTKKSKTSEASKNN